MPHSAGQQGWSRLLHILVLASYYPSEARPYVGSFIRDQVRALYARQHRVGVIAGPRWIETRNQIVAKRTLPPWYTIEAAHVPIVRMNWGMVPRIFPTIHQQSIVIAGSKAYHAYTARYGRPDVIHAHNTFYMGYLASWLRQRHNIPFILTEHSSSFLNGRIILPGQHHTARQTIAKAGAVLAVGAGLAAALQAYGKPVEIIGNIVDTDLFSLAPPLPSSPFRFASIGALIPLKRFDLVLCALATLADVIPDVALQIVGDGPLRQSLEDRAIELGVSEQVHFTGQLSRKDTRDVIHESHVIISASDIETFGVTLIEGMSSGKPVIATRSGGPDGFVTSDTGLLVEVDNADELSGAMQHMHLNYANFNPGNIRQSTIARFGASAYIDRLLNYYTELLP